MGCRGSHKKLSQSNVVETQLALRPNTAPHTLPKADSLLQEAANESDQGCYLFDGAQAGIAGHREVQVYACWQQKVDLDVLVFSLGPEFHRAVNARGHPAHCLATTCKKREKKTADSNQVTGHSANLCRALHKVNIQKDPKKGRLSHLPQLRKIGTLVKLPVQSL